MQRDSIDFGKTNIPRLFVKLFVPTLLGLLFWAIVTLADGIFVGQGVGSDALAAINIAAPLFQVASGIALMFGSGVSIVAAIHLSRGNAKAACINVTQAIVVATVLMTLVSVLVYAFPREVAFMFGGSERLMPYIIDYLYFVMPALIFCIIAIIGVFVVRLDGSPNFAMIANAVGSAMNILLDWFFIFPCGMGIKGAAVGTSIACGVSAVMVLYYFLFRAETLRFCRLKLSHTSIRLTMRNVGYMVKLGFSTFVGETALSCMMIVGNFMYMSRLGEDGVAAYSVACYTFPLVFMFGSAVAQSAQPIISYNYGIDDTIRIRRTFRLSLFVASLCSVPIVALGMFFCNPLISCFLSPSAPAFQIATDGFPLFSLSFIFFSLNLVLIGYYQAMEEARASTIFMALRGYLLIVPSFILLPSLIGNDGLWLAVPLSEALTFLCICIYLLAKHRRCKLKCLSLHKNSNCLSLHKKSSKTRR